MSIDDSGPAGPAMGHTRRVSDPRPAYTGQRHDDVALRLRERLNVRIALLSTFHDERHFFIGASGLPDDLDRAREIPLIESFCTYVRDHGAQLIVDDVSLEKRVAAHPLIAELGIHSYAGWQITDGAGRIIGVLSVMDDKPRSWTAPELILLMDEAHASAAAVKASIEEQ